VVSWSWNLHKWNFCRGANAINYRHSPCSKIAGSDPSHQEPMLWF
jgi:hypothetical protein